MNNRRPSLTPLPPPRSTWMPWHQRLAGGFGLFLAFVGVFFLGIFCGQVIMAAFLK